MASLRDIRKRIRSVKNTGKITRAMQLVAASKMKKAQDQALEGRPYTALLIRMLATVQEHQPEDYTHPFFEKREIKTRGILVLSTNRGLCGALNSNLFRELGSIKEDAQFITVGRKGRQFVSRSKRNLLADFEVSEQPKFKEIRPIVDLMIEKYKAGEIDTIDVLYPRFRNTLVQIPTLAHMLPLDEFHDWILKADTQGTLSPLKDSRDFIFEPDPVEILDRLSNRFVRHTIFHLVLEARASEHSARMVAMKTATDNAKKLADELSLQYNKARQAAITQEILEITAAAQSGAA